MNRATTATDHSKNGESNMTMKTEAERQRRIEINHAKARAHLTVTIALTCRNHEVAEAQRTTEHGHICRRNAFAR